MWFRSNQALALLAVRGCSPALYLLGQTCIGDLFFYQEGGRDIFRQPSENFNITQHLSPKYWQGPTLLLLFILILDLRLHGCDLSKYLGTAELTEHLNF